tara:strand:- start:112 stop:1818 length:1707 start_codon:yes stop_codon:yes gene_type:complete
MPGVFKKLNASDVKITPFEAHKQYDTTDLALIGATTESLAWSGKNKSTFTTSSRQYYQIDKLYYRNYINERAYRLELGDATYTTQERRLYQSASLLSLSQKTFGSEIQPNNLKFTVTKGGVTYNITDDGFGNLYDSDRGKNNFPNEDQRIFYLAPVNGFKRADLTLNYETGDNYVNSPFPDGYSRSVYDDSYFQNVVTFQKMKFSLDTSMYKSHVMGRHDSDADLSRIIVANRPYLNFNNDDFAISFYYEPTAASQLFALAISGSDTKAYILTKEGAQNSPPLGSQAGGDYSTSTTGALAVTTTPSNPAFPYRVYIKDSSPTAGAITQSIFLERFDGDNLATVNGEFFKTSNVGDHQHFLLQKKGGSLEIYKNGILAGSSTDTTTKACQNGADMILFDQRNPDGTYYDGPDTWGGAFRPTQFQIWNQSMSTDQIKMISESFTGTYPVGNIFYDNGFAVLTHPKYMDLFDGGTLDSLSYRNTHLITENEYQCTMNENEFEFTRNLSARKIPFNNSEDIAGFATGSNFKPYITTVGLYDDNANLLVVGKLAQPVRASSETDTTFVIRYDT